MHTIAHKHCMCIYWLQCHNWRYRLWHCRFLSADENKESIEPKPIHHISKFNTIFHPQSVYVNIRNEIRNECERDWLLFFTPELNWRIAVRRTKMRCGWCFILLLFHSLSLSLCWSWASIQFCTHFAVIRFVWLFLRIWILSVASVFIMLHFFPRFMWLFSLSFSFCLDAHCFRCNRFSYPILIRIFVLIEFGIQLTSTASPQFILALSLILLNGTAL